MARKSKQLERLEQDRAGRAYLTGFAVGYCLGRREAMQELRSIGNEFEAEFEALGDQLRAEAEKAVAEIREQWGLGPPVGERAKVTVQ